MTRHLSGSAHRKALPMFLLIIATIFPPQVLAEDTPTDSVQETTTERERPLQKLASDLGVDARTAEQRDSRREARQARLQELKAVVLQALDDAVEAAVAEAAWQEEVRQAEAQQEAEAAQQEAAMLTPSSPTGALADALKGKRLYHLNTSNGFSDEESIYLCSDGSAMSSKQSSAMSTGGGSTLSQASQGRSTGAWTVTGDVVQVSLQGRGTREFSASFRSNGSVGIQQNKWWVQSQSRCD